ncbi:hypothetical protein HYC85_018786 [Camellia sinensis]|uniref:Uncharacterized protein n=1 Tax=Camellia sinensis TaxID=4442 RepID=A0A7J7GVB3_CAMSI|nr:hypothetical protein HYC85_018786 [Camellia sinensis]
MASIVHHHHNPTSFHCSSSSQPNNLNQINSLSQIHSLHHPPHSLSLLPTLSLHKRLHQIRQIHRRLRW